MGTEKSRDAWDRTLWHGRPGSGRLPPPKHQLWVPRQPYKKVWHDSSRAHHGMMHDGTHGDGLGPRTYEQWECHGNTSTGGDVGEASKWLKIMQLPRTNGNSRVWGDSLGQPAVASVGNRLKLGTHGHTASQSPSKHHPLQGHRRFGEGALMPGDPRTRPMMVWRVMQSNRHWVPRSRSPMDSKCHQGSPRNDVVKQRANPRRRSADLHRER